MSNFSPPTSATRTRLAYARACKRFFAWWADRGPNAGDDPPHDVATYIEEIQTLYAAEPLHAGLIILVPIVSRALQRRLLVSDDESEGLDPEHATRLVRS